MGEQGRGNCDSGARPEEGRAGAASRGRRETEEGMRKKHARNEDNGMDGSVLCWHQLKRRVRWHVGEHHMGKGEARRFAWGKEKGRCLVSNLYP